MDIKNRLQKGLAIMAVGAVALTSFASLSLADHIADDFVDVPAWGDEAVDAVVHAEMFDGAVESKGKQFFPGTTFLRDQSFAVTSRAIGATDGYVESNPYPFQDPVTSWARDHAGALNNLGIMEGYTDGNGNTTGDAGFQDPTDILALSKMMVTAFQLEAAGQGVDPGFPDYSFGTHGADHWGMSTLQTMIAHGYVEGNDDGTLGLDPVNRVRAAMLYSRVLGLVVVGPVDPVCAEGEYMDADDMCVPIPACDASTVFDLATGECIGNVGAATLQFTLEDVFADGPIPPGAQQAPFTMLKVKNTGTEFDAAIDAVTFTLGGFNDSDDLQNVFVMVDDSYGLTSNRRDFDSENRQATLTLSQPMLLGPGEEQMWQIQADVDINAGSGNTLSIILLQASDVSVNAETTVIGDFFLEGATKTTTSATVGTVLIDDTDSLSDPTTFETEAELAAFEITASNDNNGIFEWIRLEQTGTIDAENLTNLFLEDGQGNVIAVADGLVDDYVLFVLDNPIEIAEGEDEEYLVRGDIGAADPGETILFILDDQQDLAVRDAATFYNSIVDSTPFAGQELTVEGAEFRIDYNDTLDVDVVASDTNNVYVMPMTWSSAEALDILEETFIFGLEGDSGDFPDFATLYAGGTSDGLADSGNNTYIIDLTTDGTAGFAEGDAVTWGNPVEGVAYVTGVAATAIVIKTSDNLEGTIKAVAEINPFEDLGFSLVRKDINEEWKNVISSINNITTATGATYNQPTGEYTYVSDDEFTHPAGIWDYALLVDVPNIPDYTLTIGLNHDGVNAVEYVGSGDPLAVADIFGATLESDPYDIESTNVQLALGDIQDPNYVVGESRIAVLEFSVENGDGVTTFEDLVAFLTYDSDANNDFNEITKTIADDGYLMANGVEIATATLDESNGDYQFDFDGFDYDLPANDVVEFTIEVDLRGSGDPTGRLIADLDFARFVDAQGESITLNRPANDDGLLANYVDADPEANATTLVTVGGAGTILITSKNNPSGELVANGTDLVHTATYEINANNEDAKITNFVIGGDDDDIFNDTPENLDGMIDSITVEYTGENGMETVTRPFTNGRAIFNVEANPLYADQDVNATMEIYANIVDFSQPDLDGTFIKTIIVENDPTLEVDFISSGNKTDGTAIVIDGADQIDDFLVFKNTIDMVKNSIGSGELSSGSMQGIEWEVFANGEVGGSIDYMRQVISLNISGMIDDATEDLFDFKLVDSNGSVDIDDYNLYLVEPVGATLADVKVGSATTAADADGVANAGIITQEYKLIVSWNGQNDIPTGTSETFRIDFEAIGVETDTEDSVITWSLEDDDTDEIVTLSLTKTDVNGQVFATSAGQRLFTATTDASQLYVAGRNIIWSPNSSDTPGAPTPTNNPADGAWDIDTGGDDYTNFYYGDVAAEGSYVQSAPN